MAKKVAISITVDRDLLRELDDALREVQARQLTARRQLSTRSSLIEQYIREAIGRKKAGS